MRVSQARGGGFASAAALVTTCPLLATGWFEATYSSVGGVDALVPALVHEPIRAQKLHAGLVSAIAWTPDGTKVVSAGGMGRCALRDAKTLQAWSPFGDRLLTVATDGSVQIWGSHGGRRCRHPRLGRGYRRGNPGFVPN